MNDPLHIRLEKRYAENGAGQPCSDDPADILREELPGLPDFCYERIAEEMGPSAFLLRKIGRAEAMQSVMMNGEARETFLWILSELFEAPKPRLKLGCLLLAIGLKPPGILSERHFAEQQCVSNEHVNNIVHEWQDGLQLPRTEFQKSEQAVQAARDHNRRRKSA